MSLSLSLSLLTSLFPVQGVNNVRNMWAKKHRRRKLAQLRIKTASKLKPLAWLCPHQIGLPVPAKLADQQLMHCLFNWYSVKTTNYGLIIQPSQEWEEHPGICRFLVRESALHLEKPLEHGLWNPKRERIFDFHNRVLIKHSVSFFKCINAQQSHKDTNSTENIQSP